MKHYKKLIFYFYDCLLLQMMFTRFLFTPEIFFNDIKEKELIAKYLQSALNEVNFVCISKFIKEVIL